MDKVRKASYEMKNLEIKFNISVKELEAAKCMLNTRGSYFDDRKKDALILSSKQNYF